jgi:Tol biopolymer transport system component
MAGANTSPRAGSARGGAPRGAEQPPRQAGGRRLPVAPAPALSVAGLVIVAAFSWLLLGGSLPALPGGNGPGGNGGPVRTATPSNVVIVDPRTHVPGTLLYAKDGNVWVQSGDQAHQLTSGGHDAMPAWSADGSNVYFIRNAPAEGRWVTNGEARSYNLSVPSLLQMPAAGGDSKVLLKGQIRDGGYNWSYFIREPAISPDGRTAAVISDGPDPRQSDITLKLLNLQSRKLTDPALPEIQGLGHQDPAWSPDGKNLLYVRNSREGTRGTPTITRYNVATGRTTAMTTGGYSAPSWSRDGRYVAATKTTSFGTDVVILDARNGTVLLNLTHDELSFSPVWSPLMDSVAFFKLDHGVVDLWLMPLSGTAPSWTVGEPIPLTIAAGLDAPSRPQWFIPADQLPPLPTPAAPTGAGPGPSASGAP